MLSIPAGTWPCHGGISIDRGSSMGHRNPFLVMVHLHVVYLSFQMTLKVEAMRVYLNDPYTRFGFRAA